LCFSICVSPYLRMYAIAMQPTDDEAPQEGTLQELIHCIMNCFKKLSSTICFGLVLLLLLGHLLFFLLGCA
uniref:Uncharacterized protein n=1 Tax=Aegilops tauschii subsp. strangulata TaxID=200361 RepID=A0A453GYZ5_AEGTS